MHIQNLARYSKVGPEMNYFSSMKQENYIFIHKTKEGTFAGIVRVRDVSPTPADLGGVMSVLYELEHTCKRSFLAPVHVCVVHNTSATENWKRVSLL